MSATEIDPTLAHGLARLRQGDAAGLLKELDQLPASVATVALAMLAEIQSSADGAYKALERYQRFLAGNTTSTSYLDGIAAKAAFDCGRWTLCNELLRRTLPELPSTNLLDVLSLLVLRDKALPELFKWLRRPQGRLLTDLARAKIAAIEQAQEDFARMRDELLTAKPQLASTRFELELMEAMHLPDRLARQLPPEPDLMSEELNDGKAVEWALNQPKLFPDQESLTIWNARIACNVAQLAERSADKGLRKLNRTPFALAYTHIDHLPVQYQWNRYLELIMDGTLEKRSGLLMPARRGKGAHVAMISSHFRPSTVDNYFCRWYPIWREEAERFSVVILGEENDRSKSICTAADRSLYVRNHYADLDKVLDFLAQDPPDLIFYPEVGMEPTVQMLASLRLASVQCCSWGHPLSTGLESMDYYLSADALEPEDACAHYSEKLLRLPGLGTTFDPEYLVRIRNKLGDRQVRCEDTKLELICPQNVQKWSPSLLKAWGALMDRCPHLEVRCIVDIEKVSIAALQRIMRMSWGSAAKTLLQRVSFDPPYDLYAYYQRMSDADLMLDGFPFSGGQTAVDAIMLGLPFVAVKGPRMRHRQSAAMLEYLGITELIADSPEDWCERMQWLVRDSTARNELGQIMHDRASRLFEDDRPLVGLRQHVRELIAEALEKRKN